MIYKRLEHVPAPLAVNVVAGNAPQVQQALDRLGPLQIMRIGRLDLEVGFPAVLSGGVGLEVGCGGEDLGAVHFGHVVEDKVGDFGG